MNNYLKFDPQYKYGYPDEIWFSLENMPGEEWCNIKNYEEIYKVSNYGRIKACEKIIELNDGRRQHFKEKIKKIFYEFKMYCSVVFCRNYKKERKLIHRLVAENFVPNLLNKRCVNHKDGNKLNNFYLNLEWVTHSENNIHAWKNNLMGISHLLGKHGKEHPSSKPIFQICPHTNQIIQRFDSVSSAARTLKISLSHICNVASGKYNEKTAGGFIWKYE